MTIRSVAVLGAGTMGAQLAALFANVGVPVLLLDVTAGAAAAGLDRAAGLSPDPFFVPEARSLITTAGFDEGLPRLSDADWVLEAVVERLDVKQALLARVDAARKPGAIVSSNTSGIPIAALAEGRSDDFRRHWLGTHFFNPPRYLRLLEVVPTAQTDPAVTARVTAFADHHLGKGVVVAKDSPNFIGNHIALYGVARILECVAAGDVTVEEADAITGPPIGRPKSATFRTLDLAGVDVLAHVARNLHEHLHDADARAAFALPPLVERMLAAGLTGEKAGGGFYRRIQAAGGASDILTLDLATLEYRPKQPARLGALAAVEALPLARRVRTLLLGDDRVGAFLRRTLAPTLVYAARVTPAIAASPDDVDRVMRWGFGWDLGPFELIDAIGIAETLEAARATRPSCLADGVPPLLQASLDAGRNVFRGHEVRAAGPGLQILRAARDRSALVATSAGASLVDLGDGVLAVEFHSKMNAIGGDAIQMLQAGLREASRHHVALVVGNDAPHFSAGANLMLVLLEAQDGHWDEIDAMVRLFQQTTLALRHADVPVIVAPAGLTLGGGCEIALRADRVQASAESYIGLVETGVGLIPAGGGTAEVVARASESMPPGQTDYMPAMQHAFETIAFSKTSTSATHARRLGYLRDIDGVTMNRERLLDDAKARALQRVADGYQRPAARTAIRVGGDTVLAPLSLGIHLALRAGRISPHDALVGRRLATVVAGGALPHRTTVSEAHLLDLEREAFLSLVAEPNTQQRIQHTLKTGKPLRN